MSIFWSFNQCLVCTKLGPGSTIKAAIDVSIHKVPRNSASKSHGFLNNVRSRWLVEWSKCYPNLFLENGQYRSNGDISTLGVCFIISSFF